jgi:hypothetical protein
MAKGEAEASPLTTAPGGASCLYYYDATCPCVSARNSIPGEGTTYLIS